MCVCIDTPWRYHLNVLVNQHYCWYFLRSVLFHSSFEFMHSFLHRKAKKQNTEQKYLFLTSLCKLCDWKGIKECLKFAFFLGGFRWRSCWNVFCVVVDVARPLSLLASANIGDRRQWWMWICARWLCKILDARMITKKKHDFDLSFKHKFLFIFFTDYSLAYHRHLSWQLHGLSCRYRFAYLFRDERRCSTPLRASLTIYRKMQTLQISSSNF